MAVGLALQGSLSNFAGGVLILLFKPFKVGDFIEAKGIKGTVKEISIFSTSINTFGNELAIVPNGPLYNDNIINYSKEENRRANIIAGIGYSSDIKKAKEILLEIARSNEKFFKTQLQWFTLLNLRIVLSTFHLDFGLKMKIIGICISL